MAIAFRSPSLSLFALGFFVLLTACGGDGDDRPDRTGIPEVDGVIEAVEAGDTARMRDLLQFTSQPCTDGLGAGGPPRCDGEPPGTAVEVLEVFQCEAGWARPDAVEPLLEAVAAMEPSLYAAFETPDAFFFESRYTAVFEGEDTRPDDGGLKRYVALGVDGETGSITGLALGCGVGEPAHFLLPHRDSGFDDWLIEPPD